MKTAVKAREDAIEVISGTSDSSFNVPEDALSLQEPTAEPRRLAVLPALANPLENQALAYYTVHHVEVPIGWPGVGDRWDGHLKYALEEWTCSPQDSVLRPAIRAVAHATFGRARHRRDALTAGAREYSKALLKTNMALTNVGEARSDEVLLAIMLLSFYENAVMNKTSSISNADLEAIGSRSFAHHDGAIAMLRLRRQLSQRNSRSITLDQLVRRQLLRTLLLRSMPIPAWLRDGSQYGEYGVALDIDSYQVQTAKIRHQASSLWANIAKLGTAGRYDQLLRLRRILADAQTLDDALVIWANRLPPEARYSTHKVQNHECAWTMQRIPKGNVHVYLTIAQAGMWNRYRTIRIILNDIILRIVSSLTQSSPTDMGSAEEAVVTRMHCLVEGMCASVPYVFGLIKSPSGVTPDNSVFVKVPASLKETCKASTASHLCWSLNEAIMASGLSVRHQICLRNCILDVSDVVDDGIMERIAADFPPVLYAFRSQGQLTEPVNAFESASPKDTCMMS